MHYFVDRTQAGKLLAEKIKRKNARFINPAVIVINEGSVEVGAEVAKSIHASFYLLNTGIVEVPGEDTSVGMISSQGNFTYGSNFSTGELEELQGEFHGVIEQERYKAFQNINRLIGKDGEIDKKLLKRHEVILVSDGLKSAMSLEIAVDFLKPIATRKVIIATPVATVDVVDKMHILGDELYCIGVIESFFSIDHYYQVNQIPDHKTAVMIVKNLVFSW